MQKRYDTLYLFILIVVSTIAFAIYFEANSKRIQILDEYRIEKGILDLSEIDIKNFQVLGLEGHTEFYWNKLLSPLDFANDTTLQPDGYLEIPGIWNQFEYKNKKVGGFGYATYRFVIKVKTDGWYGLRIKEFDSAYKMWVNSNNTVEAGNVGETVAAYQPNWKRNEIVFESVNNEVEVIIQIANFSHRKGGAEDRMYFGSAEDITVLKKRQLIMSSILLGILIMLAIYHFVIYFFRPVDLSVLLFSLLCFFMALRLMTTGEKIILDIFPNINWYLAIRIEYLSYKFAFPLMFAFFYSFYKKYMYEWMLKFILVFSIVFSLIVILTPVRIFSYTPLIYQVLVVIVAVYLLFLLIWLAIKRKEHAMVFLIGYSLFFGVLINDVLYYNNFINTAFLLHFGLFILAVSQSFVISKQYATAFIRIEDLSRRLEKYSRELEITVEKRTEEVVHQKNEIEQQANKLKQANNELLDLTNFKQNLTEMIVHDLKSPLNIVLNFSNDERVVYAGRQMLNLVHNMLDVQRYEKTAMDLSYTNLLVEDSVNNACSQIQYIIQEKNIVLTIDIERQLTIYADRDIVNRVFENLLSNAAKFTPYKGVIRITGKTKDNMAHICFADSGPGIPESEKELVFQKFGQFVSERAKMKGSTGIGLAFCKLAIEAHGGEIDFDSNPGIGTVFCCSVPLATDKYASASSANIQNKQFVAEEIELSIEEKEILNEVVKAMQQTKLYEIGKIKELINRIQPHRTINISRWIASIKQAIFNADYEMFNRLLKMVEENEK